MPVPMLALSTRCQTQVQHHSLADPIVLISWDYNRCKWVAFLRICTRTWCLSCRLIINSQVDQWVLADICLATMVEAEVMAQPLPSINRQKRTKSSFSSVALLFQPQSNICRITSQSTAKLRTLLSWERKWHREVEVLASSCYHSMTKKRLSKLNEALSDRTSLPTVKISLRNAT